LSLERGGDDGEGSAWSWLAVGEAETAPGGGAVEGAPTSAPARLGDADVLCLT
jgi:hypothetical protein